MALERSPQDRAQTARIKWVAETFRGIMLSHDLSTADVTSSDFERYLAMSPEQRSTRAAAGEDVVSRCAEVRLARAFRDRATAWRLCPVFYPGHPFRPLSESLLAAVNELGDEFPGIWERLDAAALYTRAYDLQKEGAAPTIMCDSASGGWRLR